VAASAAVAAGVIQVEAAVRTADVLMKVRRFMTGEISPTECSANKGSAYRSVFNAHRAEPIK
jgi:hypothetical protein